MALIEEDQVTFSKGDLVWFDQGDYPIPAEVVDVDPIAQSAKIRSSLFGDSNTIVASHSQLQHRAKPDQDLSAIDDLVQTNDLSDGTLLWTVRSRYEQGKIYTYIGSSLLAVNPRSGVNLDSYYGPEVMHRYTNRVLGSLPPHIFAIAEAAYAEMRSSGRDQVLLVSGESGSGKTETCKHLVRWLASAAPCSRGRHEPGRKNVTMDQILAASPVLESFGHASTLINENATRCAFTVDLSFQQGMICGAEYTEYVLDKNRIVSHIVGERNYHVFYELLAGLKPELKDKFGLTTAEKYFYLNQGKNIELRTRGDKENFRLLQSALDTLGFGGDHKHNIFRILAAILHIGNVYFSRQQTEQHQEGVSIGNEAEVQWISYLLQLDGHALKTFLTTKSTDVRDDRVCTPLNIDKALDIRDAIAKALYTQLFSWLFNRINQSVRKSGKEASIIFMDAFGFENMNVNTFEQLCINYANERFHAYYVDCVFRKEQDEYSNEKIVWREKLGTHLNNQPILDLLARRPNGIFHLLDDECSFPKGTDDSFLQKCHYSHVDNSLYGKPRMNNAEFCVRHFAGPVWYDASGFVEKNRDVLKANVVDVLCESQNSMISQIFKNWKNANQGIVKPKLPSAMATFANGLNLLMKKIVSGEPHFIRCICPTRERGAGKFDMELVLRQLRQLGVLETVRIRKLGYPIRFRFASFVSRYRCLVPKETLPDVEREACNRLLCLIASQYVNVCQIGCSKIFLKESVYEFLEQSRQRRLHTAAILIQKNVRAFVQRRKHKRMRKASITIQAIVRGWLQRNHYGRMKRAVLRDAEQQAKRSRQLQMYERMRQEAAAMDEPDGDKRHRNFAVTGVHYLELPDELVSVLDSMPEWDRRNRQERVTRSALSDVTLLPYQEGRHVLPPDLDNYPFSKFAQANFKTHIWQMRREPVAAPFLPKDNDSDFQDSLTIFKLILRYMNDVSLTFTQETMLANFIVQKGLSKPSLRDEIYAQLVNQTHANPHEANQERGWWLLGLCASAFPPSPIMYKYVLNYITSVDSNGYRLYLEKRFLECAHCEWSVTRRYPPCLIEHKAAQEKARMALTATLANGYKKKCQVDPWTTSSEFSQLILKEHGLDEARGWTVSFISPEVEIRMNASDYVLDVISYFELPNTFPAMKSEFLVAPRLNRPAARVEERVNEVLEDYGHEQRRPSGRSTQPSNIPHGESNHCETNTGTGPSAVRPNPLPANSGQPRNRDDSSSSSPVSDPIQDSVHRGHQTTSAPGYTAAHHSGQRQNEGRKAKQGMPSGQQMSGQQMSGQQTSGRTLEEASARVQPRGPKYPVTEKYPENRPSSNDVLFKTGRSHHQEEKELYTANQQQNFMNDNDMERTIDLPQSGSIRLPKNIPEVILPSSVSGSKNFNDNCINEDFPAGRGLPRSRTAPSEYSARSMASQIRNVAIPSKNSDVEKFLDDLFEPVLHDQTMDDIYDLRSIAASIKGGGDSSTLPRNPRGDTFSPQTPVMLTTTQMMPTMMPHMSQPVIMMMPMESMRMFNMGSMSTPMDNFAPYQAVEYGNMAHNMDYRYSLPSTDGPSTFQSNSTLQRNNHFRNRGRNDTLQHQTHYQQQLHLSPVPQGSTTLYAPAMLSPTPSAITAITAPTVPVVPLQVSTLVPMSMTALASPVLTVSQPMSPINTNQMLSQRQNSALSPMSIPPEPSYPTSPSYGQPPKQSMRPPDPPAVVHIPSDRPHPMARHHTVPLSLRSQTNDTGKQVYDQNYGSAFRNRGHQSGQERDGRSDFMYHNQQQQEVSQGNRRNSNRDYGAGTTTMTSSIGPDDCSIDYDDDTTSVAYSGTSSYIPSGIGHRNRRMFNRNGPPTTITEETSEESEAFDRQGTEFLIGRMKPTSNNARFIGSVQIGSHGMNDLHTRKPSSNTAGDRAISPRGQLSAETVPSPHNENPSTIPAAVLPDISSSNDRNQQFIGRRESAYSSRNDMPSPPIQPARYRPTNQHFEEPISGIPMEKSNQFPSRVDGRYQRNDDQFVDQCVFNEQPLQGNFDRETATSSASRPLTGHEKHVQSGHRHEKHLQPVHHHTGGKMGPVDRNDTLTDHGLVELNGKRRQETAKEQKQSQQQQYESYLAAEREWMAQMKKSDRTDSNEEHKPNPMLHQHGDEYDRYAFSKTGHAQQHTSTIGRKEPVAGEQMTRRQEGQNQDRYDDWVQEQSSLPNLGYCRRLGTVQRGYDGDRERVFGNEVIDDHGARFADLDNTTNDSNIWHLPHESMVKNLDVIRSTSRDPRRKGPVFSYENEPWTLNVQKELFYPNESLNNEEKVDLVFYQIVQDVFDWNPFRIHKRDRNEMVAVLKNCCVDVENMKSAKVPVSLKRHVVDTARSWPLYFCRYYPIIISEERRSEHVAQWLSISETGIRLLSRTYGNPEDPLKIVDHFEYEDIDRVEVPERGFLLITAFNKRQLRLYSNRAESIKALIDDYLYGPNQGKEYVRACADYITKEPNLLSFRKGDIIQLVANVQENYMGSGWLYGKLNSRYGNFPTNYVKSLSGGATLPGLINGPQIDRLDEAMAPIGDDFGDLNGSFPRPGKGKLTMMEFAMMHYKHAPSSGRIEDGEIKAPKKSKKEWTWKEFADMVKFSKSPIQSSLLKLDKSDLNKLAVDCFIGIMTYMGDYPLKKDATPVDCVYKLLMACHHHPSMRDEVYCQIVKQTTNNKSSKPDSAILGWRLFSILTAYFDCSDVLKPYLMKYLSEASNDVRRAYHGTATICLQNMRQTFKYGGRKYLLSAMEVESITNGKNLKRQVYHLPGGTKKVVNTRSITVVEEVITELCQELNIRSPLEQQEFCLCYVVEADNTMKLMGNDEYILDITTELEFKRKDYFLLLKRTVWIHPLRLDNELYIDVMFFQVVPDYLEGLLVVMRSPETISATFMDDIARLGALLHCADDHWDGQYVNSRLVAQLLPRIVQNLRHVNLEQWSERVNSKLRQLSPKITTTQARAKFLEVLQTWTLFGSTFFYMSHVNDLRIQGECLMAINKHGVQFLHMITHETLLEFRLNEVLSTQKVASPHSSTGQTIQYLDMKVGNLLQQRVISLQTDQSAEITRLLGQYIYVDSQNRGFISGQNKAVIGNGTGDGSGTVNGR